MNAQEINLLFTCGSIAFCKISKRLRLQKVIKNYYSIARVGVLKDRKAREETRKQEGNEVTNRTEK